MSMLAGVIGVGRLGRFHALKYAALETCQLIGVCDLDMQRAQAVAEELGVRVFSQPEELLAEVDVVSIAADSKAHHNLGMCALKAGVHVLMEKPLAESVEQAMQLAAAADEQQRILQVGYLERFNGALQACKEKLDSPRFVDAVRIAPFSKRGQDVDVVLDLMSHDLDLLLMMEPSPIQDVQAVGISLVTDTIDLANARLRFASGCVANFTASRVATRVERKMRIFQQDCCFSLDFSLPACITLTMESFNEEKQTVARQLEISQGDALEAEIKAFLHSVYTGSPPPVSAKDGLRVMEAAAQIKAGMAKHV